MERARGRASRGPLGLRECTALTYDVRVLSRSQRPPVQALAFDVQWMRPSVPSSIPGAENRFDVFRARNYTIDVSDSAQW